MVSDIENESYLAQRERETLAFLSQGLEKAEIAKEMGIRENTVNLYINILVRKTGKKDRQELADAYLEYGDSFEEIVAQVNGPYRKAKPSSYLTKREQQILECLIRGMSDREIAREIGTAIKTVGAFLHQIAGKLGTNNRIHLAITYIKKLKDFEQIPSADMEIFYNLKPRQEEILQLLKRGMSYKEIAEKIGVVESTVNYNMGVLRRKTNTKNNVQLALAYLKFKEAEVSSSN